MWSWRLQLITGDACYADIIERVLLNALTAGVSLDGASYFYVNPLQVRAGHVDPDDGRGRAARSQWYEIACCPPNLMRTLARLSQYFVTTTASGVQIWQYAAAQVRLLMGGAPLRLSVDTVYPFDGSVVVRVEQAPPSPVEVALRVPAWCQGASGLVRRGPNEQSVRQLTPGALWREAAIWGPGDAVILDLPMPVRLTRPHPRIDAVRGTVAFERGPVVYCLEEEDAGGPKASRRFGCRRT